MEDGFDDDDDDDCELFWEQNEIFLSRMGESVMLNAYISKLCFISVRWYSYCSETRLDLAKLTPDSQGAESSEFNWEDTSF